MTVLIDLKSYVAEVEAFVALADAFVDRSSAVRLDEVLRDLKTGVDAGQAEWTWRTRADILFRPSRAYDGPGKTHVDTSLVLGFTLDFARSRRTAKRSTVWQVESGSTRATLCKGDGELPLHFDYKNSGQWGPQLHIQVHERVSDVPIPRLVSTAFLPTDCADLMLAELHHEEWRETQSAGANSRHVGLIRDAQENRSRAYVDDVARLWRDTKRIGTRLSMLQDYSATLIGLPDHKGQVAAL